MNLNDDHQLDSLLRYNERLTDEKFTQQITGTIDKQLQQRRRWLGFSVLLSIVVGGFLLIDIGDTALTFLTQAILVYPYLFTIAAMAILSALAWLTGKEF